MALNLKYFLYLVDFHGAGFVNKMDSMSKRFDRVDLNRRSMKFESPPLLTHKLLVFKLTLCASRTRVPRLHLPRRRLRVPASRRKHYQRWFVLAISFHSAHLNSFVSLFLHCFFVKFSYRCFIAADISF